MYLFSFPPSFHKLREQKRYIRQSSYHAIGYKTNTTLPQNDTKISCLESLLIDQKLNYKYENELARFWALDQTNSSFKDLNKSSVPKTIIKDNE